MSSFQIDFENETFVNSCIEDVELWRNRPKIHLNWMCCIVDSDTQKVVIDIKFGVNVCLWCKTSAKTMHIHWMPKHKLKLSHVILTTLMRFESVNRKVDGKKKEKCEGNGKVERESVRETEIVFPCFNLYFDYPRQLCSIFFTVTYSFELIHTN